MIVFKKKEITTIIHAKRLLVSIVYAGRVAWEGVKSCFGGGYWDNDKPWDNKDAWNNG